MPTHRSEDLHADRRKGLVPGFDAYERRQAEEAAKPAKKATTKKAGAKKAASAKKAR